MTTNNSVQSLLTHLSNSPMGRLDWFFRLAQPHNWLESLLSVWPHGFQHEGFGGSHDEFANIFLFGTGGLCIRLDCDLWQFADRIRFFVALNVGSDDFPCDFCSDSVEFRLSFAALNALNADDKASALCAIGKINTAIAALDGIEHGFSFDLDEELQPA